jgi:predicted acyltransferase
MGAIKFHSGGKPTNLYGWLYQTCITPFFTPVNASLVAAIALVFIIWLILYPLYKKRIIIKL